MSRCYSVTFKNYDSAKLDVRTYRITGNTRNSATRNAYRWHLVKEVGKEKAKKYEVHFVESVPKCTDMSCELNHHFANEPHKPRKQ